MLSFAADAHSIAYAFCKIFDLVSQSSLRLRGARGNWIRTAKQRRVIICRTLADIDEVCVMHRNIGTSVPIVAATTLLPSQYQQILWSYNQIRRGCQD